MKRLFYIAFGATAGILLVRRISNAAAVAGVLAALAVLAVVGAVLRLLPA